MCKVNFAYINICFNQILDEKSSVSAKIEAIKHLHAEFLLTVEKCQRPSRLQRASDRCMARCYWNVYYITFKWFTIELLVKNQECKYSEIIACKRLLYMTLIFLKLLNRFQ